MGDSLFHFANKVDETLAILLLIYNFATHLTILKTR